MNDLAPPLAALQHKPAPRPLPLFLDLVRRCAETDPELAAGALEGLRVYADSPRPAPRGVRSVALEVAGASLRECGGSGRPIILVPSLINPPHVLDLDAETSLAEALVSAGRVLLLDWGPAERRAKLDVAGHVRKLLLPLIRAIGESPFLVGYCLGGTMALGAASLAPVRAVATLASPWRFSAYPKEARLALATMWRDAKPASERLGVLPIEVLQAAFWSLDPKRIVAKYARLPQLAPDSAELRRFLSLEDWANGGEPLPLPAARELIEELFGTDCTGSRQWLGGQFPDCPLLHFVARADGIVPAASVAPGPRLACPAGHVGMVVGRSARNSLQQPLRNWLTSL